ncbi:hypothetical protein PP175_21285 [Aneurinibacillus sp. Ricciae_BoGa-3]|uniref:hypothetical protein n=1 Tax=Aneurinibacillus sp. Ricciae_BoGa-3 TaxID=3022697 RepID=UPI00233FB72D|nr:hypothetical protein [Aneurinibacillus sp. Ricciae_BoGa-3]WCK53825.1 hypothetical protein PP175_21285 [Aneurinibacillus sp. Ricciae_BoGa-3]
MFQSYNLYISLGNIVAVVIIVLTQFIWSDKPEFIPGFSAKVGNILFNISMSYIVSYIFYVIVTYLPDRKNKRYINTHVQKLLESVIRDFKQVTNYMEQASKITIDLEHLSQNNIEDMLKNINPNSHAPVITFNNNLIVNLSWSNYLLSHIKNEKENINKVFLYMPFLDARLILNLNEIISCDFYQRGEQIFQIPISNTDLSTFKQEFFNYCKLMIQFEKKTKGLI